MNEKKKIACFFTVGYTELYAMKLFMKKKIMMQNIFNYALSVKAQAEI